MTGKEKCEFLKEIRVRMAELNGIPYKPRECHHEGDCVGTCPLCDKEAAELMTKLKEKESEGAEIKNFGIEAIEDPFRGSNNPLVTEKDLHEMRQDIHREREPLMGDIVHDAWRK